jgi:outer membrane protein TolC
LAARNNPQIRAATAALAAAHQETVAAWGGHLPTLTLDYFYGIDATHFAVRTDGIRNLGYAATASLNLPVWNWGATQSKVRVAEYRQRQARIELSQTQRELLANLRSFYDEAQTVRNELDALRSSADLAVESLRLTALRYQGGEATALELVDAQNALTAARNAYDDGDARYRVALANLQTLTGTF